MTFQPYLEAVSLQIRQLNYGEQPLELYEPIRYIMALGGKRLRPLLTVLSAQLFTNNWHEALKPAAAVEVFHNFTLMHDDIMDQAPLRRGKPTVHEKWNQNIAILSGDVMLVNAYELLLAVAPDKLATVIGRFNRTAAEVCEGQQWDMNFEQRTDVTIDEYLNMIRLKTSVLLGFALELGAIIGGADTPTVKALYKVGVNMGLGFQLKDDLLDVYGDPQKFGKQVGGDIIANKKTFMLIEALQLAEGTAKIQLQKWLSMPQGTYEPALKVSAVTQIYSDLGIDKIAQLKADAYFAECFETIYSLPISAQQKTPLLDFATYLVGRDS